MGVNSTNRISSENPMPVQPRISPEGAQNLVSFPAGPEVAGKSLALPPSTGSDEEITREIENGFVVVDQVKYKLEHLDETTQRSSQAQTLAETIRDVVAGTVMNGAASVADVTVPYLMHTPSTQIPELGLATQIVNVASDLIQFIAGFAGSIHKSVILKIAMEELQRLKELDLTPSQAARLIQLERDCKYEKEMWVKKTIEHAVISFRVVISSVQYALTWMVQNPVTKAIIGGGDVLISGVGAAFNGLFFYLAQENLINHRAWSTDFKTWIATQTKRFFRVDEKDPTYPTILAQAEAQCKKMLEDRKERVQNQKNEIKKQLDAGKITLDDIKNRLMRFGVAVEGKTEDELIASYVDYHAVLDPTIKHAIADMVQKKHEVQKSFLKAKRLDLAIQFIASTILFGAAAALAILAFVANPIAGTALILTLLSVGSTVLGVGLMIAGYAKAYQLQPRYTAAFLKGATLRVAYYNARSSLSSIREGIAEFNRKIKQRRRDAADRRVQRLKKISPEESLQEKGKLETKLKEQEKKSQEWAAKAQALEEELQTLAWKDFAEKASLQVAAKEQEFDTLETLNSLLMNCDFNLLSDETQKLLDDQLGINVHQLQEKIGENPEDPGIVKKLVRDFFNMTDDAFTQFIAKQRYVRPT